MTRTKFEELVRQSSRRLYIFAFRILRDREEAEDAVQEVFIKLWNMGDRLDEYKSTEALATTMIRNLCIDMLRKKRNILLTDTPAENNVSLSSATPHEVLENTETGEILGTIMAKLPEPFRTVVEMKELEGKDYVEIAAATGQNINTLRVVLSRARKMIRDEFNRYQHEKRSFETADRKVL